MLIKKYGLIILGSLYMVLMVFLAISNSQDKSERSDFYVYWKTGQNFSNGNDLYLNNNIPRAFIYPPFAAFLFQVLSIVPFKTSAIIFFLINAIILPVFIFFLLKKLLIKYGFPPERLFIPISLSFLASLNYFWSNLGMLQVNYILFAISLTGLFFLIEKKYHIAAIFLTLATFIKIYPVFLLIYIFFLSPKKKVIISIFLSVFLCMAIPTLQRGIKKGYFDHKDYYETFLKEFKEGKVIPDLKNHTLKAFIVKASSKTENLKDIDISLYKNKLQIMNIFSLLLLAVLILMIYIQIKKRRNEFSFLILSAIFIFTHMISGISWAAHFVTSTFWYLPLFLIDPSRLKPKSLKFLHFVFQAISIFLAFEGTDTTGKILYVFLRKYDIYVIFPIILFVYYSYLFFKGEGIFYKRNFLKKVQYKEA